MSFLESRPRSFLYVTVAWNFNLSFTFFLRSTGTSKPTYPSSKPKGVDWDKLEAQMKKEVCNILFSFDFELFSDATYYTLLFHPVNCCLVIFQEKDEKLDGDAALNKFFREIYSDADEDTRRAMSKSFVRATILSFLTRSL